MSKRETDISQIRKYLNGELDAKAMHQLERQAQDDPFLMDALEGYENAAGDQQAQLNELTGRLSRRVERKEIRIIPWRLISIAASVLIVCSIGVWWLNSGNQASPPKLAQVVKPVVKPAKARPADTIVPLGKEPVAALAKTSPPPVQIKKAARSQYQNAAPATAVAADAVAEVNIKDSVPKDATPLNERIVMGYTGKRKKDTTGSHAAVDLSNAKIASATSPEQQLPGQAPGAADNNSPNTNQAKNVIVQGNPIAAKSLKEISMADKNYASSAKIITGRVVSKDDGLPIPGVSVRIKGTNTGAVTDVNGRFTLPADNGSSLVVGYIGYQTQEVSAGSRDSVKTISLQPSNNSLAEVVVANKPKSDMEEPTPISAHPNTGWSSFRKYLKENAHSPDGKTGVVKLSFTVYHNGTISDIKVEKGLSQATDQAAIDLVNNGPDWVGSTNGKPGKVTLRVKFVK